MEQKRNTKQSLLVAALSLLVVFAALLGTTFAGFTDSVSSTMNHIISGKLDVGMNYWNSTRNEYIDATEDPLFDVDALWEPGYMDIAYLEIENRGNLSFNYLFAVYPTEETVGYRKDGTTFYVSDYLVYGIVKYDVETKGEIATREDALALIADADMGLTEENLQYGTMHPDSDSVRLALIVYMPVEVTSQQANHNLASGHPSPKVTLAVDVYATQNTYEFDSFSDQYDAGLTPVWAKPIWRFAPDGYEIDSKNKKITVNSIEALKYLGTIYDDMVSHPYYRPEEWEIVLGCDMDFGGEELSEPLRFGGFKSFNGNNKTITNVILNYIYVDEQIPSVGLFDSLPDTKDLTINNITVHSETTAAGALAGKLTGTSYSGITVSNANISGVGFLGGLIGWGNFLHPIDFSGIQILNPNISLFGSGSGSAGGIAGYVGGSSVTVSDSKVDGLDATGVQGTGSYVGGMFGEIDCDMQISESTITEITIYRDVYIGAITGKIYSSRDVKLVSNSVNVVVNRDGTKTVVPFTSSGDIEDTDTEVDWNEIQTITGALKTTYNGHFYEVFVTSSDIRWTAANQACLDKFGHLVTITSAGENNAVVSMVSSDQFAKSAWLGGYRTQCYGDRTGPHIFEWVTGEEWNYTNWDSGEPNDSHTHQGGCEAYLHMYGSGKWNDYQDNHTDMRGYVCEWDSLQSYLNYLTALSDAKQNATN